MRDTLVLLLVALLVTPSFQNINDNDVETEDISPFQEAAKALLQGENAGGLGGIISSFLQSEGGKNLGDMLLGASNNGDATGQILAGLGNILAQNSGSNSGPNEGLLNPALIGNIMGMLNNGAQQGTNGKGMQEGFDIGALANIMASFMGQGQGGDGGENIFTYIPLIMNTINSFMGPEAQAREDKHKDHAWALPPIVERIHIFFDHLMNSELGAKVANVLGGEKFIKIFTDENGKFRYAKFIELMENHSFRKHWIQLVTKRVADLVSYFADPYTQKRFLQTGQFFVNSFLKSQGFPAGAMFNPDRPVESISAGINHVTKKYMGQKYDVKQYVKPLIEYVKDLMNMAQDKGILGRAVDSTKLSDKLADTINLDIIEPIIRVNRAYKFAWKVPQCDKYVMCLVNEEPLNDESTLPALKKMLSRTTSLVLSWFLSGHTGTSFWSLYNIISDESNCKARYLDDCHGFHLDELRVTTEYVHNEL